ncbi:MAG: DUF3943 domain-containing protein [Prevotellaceae bacterium]|nr:DUF3943 domain-containing protein [Prevotellaceae bacterium]
MKHNLNHAFVWDNDAFTTNLFGHPYHGGLYFNAARSNGMNFYESIPYIVAGSLMWEYLMENEPPSINDFISTPIGGIALGEITFRISDLLIDNNTSGLNRFSRELLAGIISPMRGLNRIINGDAWKVRNVKRTFPEFPENIPVNFNIITGYGVLIDNANKKIANNGMYIDLGLTYNCLFSDDNEKPYDAFVVRAAFNFFSGQPVIRNINIIGQLWGENIHLKNEKIIAHWGFFQHFDYHNLNPIFGENTVKPYRISETAAYGIGIQLKTKSKKTVTSAFAAYLNAVLLGGYITDYYQVLERDYNMGSGFSVKINSQLLFGAKTSLVVGLANYRVFSWKGYSPEINLSRLTHEEQLNLNVQGDKGNVSFTICNLKFKYCFRKHCLFSMETSYYMRNSTYKYFPDTKYGIMESKLGLEYTF